MLTTKIIIHLNVMLLHVWCHAVFDTAKSLTTYQEKVQKYVIVMCD
jgi:hypothetical protein